MKKNFYYLSLLLGFVFGMVSFSACCSTDEDILPPVPGGDEPVAVTGVTLNMTELAMNVGDAPVFLIATVAPDNATDKTVIWTSSAPAVATVGNGVLTAADADVSTEVGGMVTPVGPGTAIITAKAGDKDATCAVTVTAAPAAWAGNEYNYGVWNATTQTVDYTKKTATGVTEMTNTSTPVTNWAGWYTVTGDNVQINSNVTLTDDTYLILCDGAKLTIPSYINGGNKKLYIYGQGENTGKLEVACPGGMQGIYSLSMWEIHGGDLTFTNGAFPPINTSFTQYGGKLTAEQTVAGSAIEYSTGYVYVYGGELIAKGKTNGSYGNGISVSNTLIFGGKVKAYGGNSAYASGISGTVYVTGGELEAYGGDGAFANPAYGGVGINGDLNIVGTSSTATKVTVKGGKAFGSGKDGGTGVNGRVQVQGFCDVTITGGDSGIGGIGGVGISNKLKTVSPCTSTVKVYGGADDSSLGRFGIVGSSDRSIDYDGGNIEVNSMGTSPAIYQGSPMGNGQIYAAANLTYYTWDGTSWSTTGTNVDASNFSVAISNPGIKIAPRP